MKYRLVRRFVQFTGATWEYSCLHELEKGLAVDGGFWPDTVMNNAFEDIRINLYQMNFRELSGCKVDFFRCPHESEDILFQIVGMQAFGSTIRFRRFEKGSKSGADALQGTELALLEDDIAIPTVVDNSVSLDENSSHITDYYSFSIGGAHDVSARNEMEKKIFSFMFDEFFRRKQ